VLLRGFLGILGALLARLEDRLAASSVFEPSLCDDVEDVFLDCAIARPWKFTVVTKLYIEETRATDGAVRFGNHCSKVFETNKRPREIVSNGAQRASAIERLMSTSLAIVLFCMHSPRRYMFCLPAHPPQIYYISISSLL
jgi:hypothetical protein